MKVLVRYMFTVTLCLLMLVVGQQAHSQCTNQISVFPYTEGFEINNGIWAISNALHWEWGAVVPGSKNIITAAGSGQKCWVVGGLSGANYSSGTSSLRSPCFNISSLVNPEVSFKIIWETEKDYDGVQLEYSTDAGNTWSLLGSQNSDSNCIGVNWYNSASVRFIGNLPGWSGSVQSGGGGSCQSGGGSGSWLLARHSLSSVAGATSLMFRFNFGAGTVCNSYEGFAFDDFTIRETPPASADFTYTCQPNNQVDFLLNAAYCQQSISWNFGDVASGVNNTSTSNNPSHVFSGPGSYVVTAQVQYTNGTSANMQREVNILGLSTNVTQGIRCNGDNTGAITANASGGNGGYQYSWNTTPPATTPTISGLSANAYTVTVSAANACSISETINLQQPLPLVASSQLNPATCTRLNGSITLQVAGGTSPYTYNWNNGQTTSVLSNLATGTYQCDITDAAGCETTISNITVPRVEIPALPRLGRDTTICDGQTLLLQPGNFARYLWQDASTGSSFLVTETGTYSVAVTNAEGCSGADTINVTVQCYGLHFPSSFTPNGDGLNDSFGPVGDLALLSDFKLQVYNRWGQQVFTTLNPYEKWDGKVNGGNGNPETFVWISTYKLKGVIYSNVKGTVILLR